MSAGGWHEVSPEDPVAGAVKRRVYWDDRLRLEALPVGESFEREYVPGEFRTDPDLDFTQTEVVRVWYADLFKESTPERGYIRMREPLPVPTTVFSDAEDAVNPFLQARPPEGA